MIFLPLTSTAEFDDIDNPPFDTDNDTLPVADVNDTPVAPWYIALDDAELILIFDNDDNTVFVTDVKLT